MRLVSCTRDRHAETILAIFNDAILHSTALYEYRPRTLATIESWLDAKAARGLPVIGVETDEGALMGFGTYGAFRDHPAYKYTVEHSVYVDERFRRRGVGRRIVDALVEAATAQQAHVLVGGIDAANLASIALHEQLGFTHCGTVRQAGFKFGRWLDLALYQKVLDTPRQPADG